MPILRWIVSDKSFNADKKNFLSKNLLTVCEYLGIRQISKMEAVQALDMKMFHSVP